MQKIKINFLKKQIKNIVYFIILTAILQLSLNYNYFNAANPTWFKNHQRDSEALVIGKIIDSKNHKMFNKQVMGRYTDINNKESINYTYNLYFNNEVPEVAKGNYIQSFGL